MDNFAHDEIYAPSIVRHRRRLAYARAAGDKELAQMLVSSLAKVECKARTQERLTLEEREPERIGYEVFGDQGWIPGDEPPAFRFFSVEPEAIPTDGPLGTAVDEFLTIKRQHAKSGIVTATRYDIVSRDVQRFRDWFGAGKSTKDISPATLTSYHAYCADIASERGWSAKYVSEVFSNFRSFLRWLDEHELIERLPRNFHSRELQFRVPHKKVETLTPKEYRRLFDGTAPRTQLYLLLMLNCGMYQKDISDLKQGEVNWKRGQIVRKRSKTAMHASVPEVTYKLWPETLSLLKKYRSNDPVFALTNEDGKPLRSATLEGERYKRIDNIRSAYTRAFKRLKITARPLSLIRKTGSSALRQNPKYAGFAEYYLGHAPATVADRHYIKPSAEMFDAALGWLRIEFEETPLGGK